MLIHPTLELSLVLVVVSALFVASSAIIVDAGNKKNCDAVDKDDMSYKFAIAVLVVAVLVLVYGLGFLGLHLYDKYM